MSGCLTRKQDVEYSTLYYNYLLLHELAIEFLIFTRFIPVLIRCVLFKKLANDIKAPIMDLRSPESNSSRHQASGSACLRTRQLFNMNVKFHNNQVCVVAIIADFQC